MSKKIVVSLIALAFLAAGLIVWMRVSAPSASDPEEITEEENDVLTEEELEELAEEETEETEEESPATTEEETPVAEEPPAAEEEEPQVLVVTYTDAGFSVSNMSGALGQTVVFRNESSSSLQVASDPHPAHSCSSGYNQGVTAPGGEVSVTLGATCGIHNHLAPQHGMTLTVN